jgi:hypothetical protein
MMNTRQGKRQELRAVLNLKKSEIENAMFCLTAKKDKQLRERIQNNIEDLRITIARLDNGLYEDRQK